MVMDRVVIGMDPHKGSVRIEAGDTGGVLGAAGTFGSDTGSYRGMLGLVRQWPDRVWAVEGANGVAGRSRSGCSPMGSGCWMCRRSWPPGPGCSTSGGA
jgi:hypothetical protein